MLTDSNRFSAKILDCLLTKYAVAGASSIFFLTPSEELSLEKQFRPRTGKLQLLQNAAPEPLTSHSYRGETFKIIFAARLHRRKNVMDFAEVAGFLREKSNLSFEVIGPDEGQLLVLEDFIKKESLTNIQYSGAFSRDVTRKKISESHLLVLPSIDEPFPLSVLEAIAEGTPVVVTTSCGLAPKVTAAKAGIAVDPGDISRLASAVLTIKENWLQYNGHALEAARTTFGKDQVLNTLTIAYHQAVGVRHE